MDKEIFIKVFDLINQLEEAKKDSDNFRNFPFAMVTYDGLTAACIVFDWMGDKVQENSYVQRHNGLRTDTEYEFAEVIPVIEELIRKVKGNVSS